MADQQDAKPVRQMERARQSEMLSLRKKGKHDFASKEQQIEARC